MVVDEQFSLLAHFVNLDKTYYFVLLIERVDVWTSWEACFVILLVVYESVFIWSLWISNNVPTLPTTSNSGVANVTGMATLMLPNEYASPIQKTIL
jgi:hypothetical protein